MIKFAAAYSSLLVGFMVMFMILFSEQDVFNSNFFGVFGKVITAYHPPKNLNTFTFKVLVMMTGEFEYEELMYPQTEKVSNSTSSHPGKIEDEIDFNHFPGLAHISVLAFIIFVGVVMMNLLVAIAVNDIKELSKTAKRDQLLSQAELINYMERIHGFWVFQKLLPSKIQDWFKATVLNRGRSVTMTKEVLYANNSDQSLSESLKNELYEFCIK